MKAMMRARTSLNMWKLSATRAMELVRLPTMSSTSMKLPVMPSMLRIFGPVPQQVQLKILGNFILNLEFKPGNWEDSENKIVRHTLVEGRNRKIQKKIY